MAKRAYTGYRIYRPTYSDRAGKAREASKWAVEFQDHSGWTRPRRLSAFADWKASDELGRKIVRLVEMRAAGDAPDLELLRWLEGCPDTMRTRLAQWGLLDAQRLTGSKALAVHLSDFEASLKARGRGAKHVSQTVGRVKRVFEACGLQYWSQISAGKVESHLASLRDGDDGIKIRTFNGYVTDLKNFCSWMVENGRAQASPLRTLRLIAITDAKQRRALDVDEMRRLLTKAKAGADAYGSQPATAFGPNRLRVVRQQMIEANWARTYINEQVRWIRSMFKWGASHEMLPETVHRHLTTMEPLRKGEAQKEGKVVRPVPRPHIRRVRRHLPQPVRALIALQLLTGARANELVRLKATDLDTSSDVWIFKLDDHKTAHHGKERIIYFGPRAQKILGIFMKPGRSLDRPLFDPREANADGKRRGAKAGRRPDQKPSPTKTDRTIGEHYTTASYRRAIHRACDTVGLANWGPNRLRHNAATFLRREFGIDVAATILGHSSLVVTQIYAEADQKKARQVMAKVG